MAPSSRWALDDVICSHAALCSSVLALTSSAAAAWASAVRATTPRLPAVASTASTFSSAAKVTPDAAARVRSAADAIVTSAMSTSRATCSMSRTCAAPSSIVREAADTRCDTCRVSSTTSSEAVWACSASFRISSATTAKPRPAWPARAASMAALSASKLVCSAIRPTVTANRPMSSAVAVSVWASAAARSTVVRTFCIIASERSISTFFSPETCSMEPASAFTSSAPARTPCARDRIVWSDASAARISRTWPSAPLVTSVMADAIWPAERAICSDTEASSCAEVDTSSAVRVATVATFASDSDVTFMALASASNSNGSPVVGVRIARLPIESWRACVTSAPSGSAIHRTVVTTVAMDRRTAARIVSSRIAERRLVSLPSSSAAACTFCAFTRPSRCTSVRSLPTSGCARSALAMAASRRSRSASRCARAKCTSSSLSDCSMSAVRVSSAGDCPARLRIRRCTWCVSSPTSRKRASEPLSRCTT